MFQDKLKQFIVVFLDYFIYNFTLDKHGQHIFLSSKNCEEQSILCQDIQM